jgi:Methyltransferase domain
MGDIEQSETWLQGLARLNRVVAATGQPLIGNLCYENRETGFADAPPRPILRAKRDRFRNAVEGHTKLLEIGVNGGHSAYVALSSNPALEFHGVDICQHAYVRPAVAHLQSEFPGRFFFYEGSCLEVLPALAERGLRFDVFHIDGAKGTYLEDVLNCERVMAGDSATLIMDDTQVEFVDQVWRLFTAAGVIAPDPLFPAMPDSERYRNEIGTLKPVAAEERADLLRRGQESKLSFRPRPRAAG